LLVSLVETIGTFAKQESFLNLPVAIVVLAAFGLALLYNVYNFWFGPGGTHSHVIIGAVVLVALASMPFQIPEGHRWPAFEHSWVWWTTGGASVAIGVLLPRWWAWAYMAIVPTAWFFICQSAFGGSFGLQKALEDAAYVTLFPAALVSMVQLLRSAANDVDLALESAAAAASERARIDAIERERSRIDALVHDSVLTTFLLAARASTLQESEAAKLSAQEALAKLQQPNDEESNDAISFSSFARALTEAVKRQDSHTVIDATGSSSRLIPAEVASALADATAQALTNSLQHAGSSASRLLRVKISDRQIKIVLRDDGPGFRPARISKSRLGLRVSIIERVEAVGGRVFIETAPGEGATIVIEWELA
jgi:signal transduction histidine kinase